MPRWTPEDLLEAYPEIDFLVAEGGVSSGYMISVHNAFYGWAADHVEGKTVLDAGCGTGFGTALLARRAARAVGIDLKDRLLEYARQTYGQERLDFVRMEAGRLAFADGSFDVVVADELLEHLPEHVPFLDEAKRVLRPGGLFVCATVNRVHSFGTAEDPLNRNHFREWNHAEFRAELSRWFAVEEVLGQRIGERYRRYMKSGPARAIEWILMRLKVKHKIPAGWRARVRGAITGVRPEQAASEDFAVGGEDVPNALYLVALARKA